MGRPSKFWGNLHRVRLALLGLFGVAAYSVILWALRDSSYIADPLLDAYLEMAGSLIAFTFAANALVRFRGTRDRISLILAFGFVVAGLIEAGSSMTFYRGISDRGVRNHDYLPWLAGRANAPWHTLIGRTGCRKTYTGLARTW